MNGGLLWLLLIYLMEVVVLDHGLIEISKAALKSDLSPMQRLIIKSMMMKMALYALYDAENIIAKIKRELK